MFVCYLFLLDILDALDERLACSDISQYADILINCLQVGIFVRKPVYLDSLIAEASRTIIIRGLLYCDFNIIFSLF